VLQVLSLEANIAAESFAQRQAPVERGEPHIRTQQLACGADLLGERWGVVVGETHADNLVSARAFATVLRAR
jgi:hypothetical protein